MASNVSRWWQALTITAPPACEGDPLPPPPDPEPIDPCVAVPLVPTVTVSAPGQTVTWTGTLRATDTRGCTATVSQ